MPGESSVYDTCRKKTVPATPEEMIRQSVVRYFRFVLRTPLRYIQTEVSMKRYGFTTKNDRADILILRPDGNTILAVIECKAPHIKLDATVISQTLRYAKSLNTEFAFATNGKELITLAYDKKMGICR